MVGCGSHVACVVVRRCMVTVPRLAAAVYVAVVQFASFMFDRLVCQIVARRWLRHSFARDSVKEII